MSKRPILKWELSKSQFFIEISAWVILVANWVIVLQNYALLPETIPIHFNAAGQADDFGSKNHILGIPIIATILILGMTILNKYPHNFNYLVEITHENALKNYKVATNLIRYLKLIIAFVFILISIKTIQNANGTAEGLGNLFSPIVLGLIFVPIIKYLFDTF